MAATRSERLTMPTTRPSRTIGMRFTPRVTMSSANSGKVACASAVVDALGVITSRAVRVSRRCSRECLWQILALGQHAQPPSRASA